MGDVIPLRRRRPDYWTLTDDQREAIHDWLRQHDCEPADTPLDGILGCDAATGEWRIEQYLTRDGRKYLDEHGKVAKVVVRRREMAPLPWPEVVKS
jgi:hypothetical protein